MLASRSALRASRNVRIQPLLRTARRLESTSVSSGSASASNTGPAVIGGLVGGGITLLGGYAWYRYSGASTFINTAHAAKSKFEAAFKKSTEQAPEPNEALQWLRQTATSYAGFIPGAKGYVNSAFDDIDAIQKKHGSEVEKIVNNAYGELKDVSKKGASLDAVSDAWEVIQKAMKQIGELAGDAAEDILNNHPDLKKKVGGNLDQLKGMGDQYGPEAKKKVDETWDQVKNILKGGVGLGTADQLRKLVQDKVQEVKKLGDQAWQKGMEQAGPALDKAPKVKELVEQNKDKLMQGNLSQLWEKVQQAAKSGDSSDLESFVKETVQQGKDKAGGGSGGGLEQYFNMIPGGSEIMPKLQQLQELAQKHGDEAEKLAKDTFKEIQDVLSKKVDEGQKLAEKAKKDAGK